MDVRIIAATHKDLRAMAKEGAFREDLLYRLDVLSITLPPLRERPEEIGALAEHFLRELAAEIGRPPPALDEGALARLASHPWPGNVRELRNALERILVLSNRPVLHAGDFPDTLLAVPAPREMKEGAGAPESWSLEDLERWHLGRAMRAAGGNKVKAARLLGIDRSTLYAKMRKYGIGEGRDEAP